MDVFLWDVLKSLEGPLGATLLWNLMDRQGVGIDLALVISIAIFVTIPLISYAAFGVLVPRLLLHRGLPRECPNHSRAIRNWHTAFKLRDVFKTPFYMNGSMLAPALMRACGAVVGKGCFFGSGERVLVDPHWGDVGDNVTFDYNAKVRQHSFEHSLLKWGPNHVGQGTSIAQGGMLAMSDAGENVELQYGSVTWKGSELEAGGRYEGAPAQRGDPVSYRNF